jgi:hypothetical protein
MDETSLGAESLVSRRQPGGSRDPAVARLAHRPRSWHTIRDNASQACLLTNASERMRIGRDTVG